MPRSRCRRRRSGARTARNFRYHLRSDPAAWIDGDEVDAPLSHGLSMPTADFLTALVRPAPGRESGGWPDRDRPPGRGRASTMHDRFVGVAIVDVRRVHLVLAGTTDTTNGPVELTVAGGECLVFDARPDGEELVCTPGPVGRPVHRTG